MRADDLSILLGSGRDEDEGTRWAQGTIVAWDQSNGRNRVSVAGTELQDLPILNTAEAIALKVGHVVGLLRWKSQWFILGRIVIPGATDFAAASVAFRNSIAYREGMPGTASWTNPIVSTTIDVPPWATEAAVIVNGALSMNNTSGVLGNLSASLFVQVDNGDKRGPGTVQTAAVDKYWVALNPNDSQTINVRGASVVRAGLTTGVNWAADSGNFCSINILAIFRSTV